MITETLNVAIVAIVFVFVLIEPGMILAKYGDFLEWLATRALWLAKPLGYCGACFSGQLGFWWYISTRRDEYVLLQHIVFVSQTIFFYLLLKVLFEWSRKNGYI